VVIAEWKATALSKISPDIVHGMRMTAMGQIVEYLDSIENGQNSFSLADLATYVQKGPSQSSEAEIGDLGLSAKEVKSILALLPEVIDTLQEIGLLHRNSDLITDVDVDKIGGLYLLLRHISRSQERMMKWACHYLFSKGVKIFSSSGFVKMRINQDEERIPKKLDLLFRKFEEKGLHISRKYDEYIIEQHKEDKTVVDILIGDIELHSRWSSGSLEDILLRKLDLSALSNSELAEIMHVDKSTISRVIKRLRGQKVIKPVEHVAAYGRQFWITNCDKCPWQYTKESCRKESIDTLIDILATRYALKVDEDYFKQVDDNHTLMHLKEMFSEIPEQTFIEIEKRKTLNKIVIDMVKRIGPENIVIKDHEFLTRSSNRELKPLDFPFPPLLSANDLKEWTKPAKL